MAILSKIKKLGSGGFGEVWSCKRETDGSLYAMKTLLDLSSNSIKRFQREVRLLRKLDHPRVVKVSAYQLDKSPYLYVMPLYRKSLHDCFPAIVGDRDRIRKVFQSILDGMQYAHEQGVIHRDLKPENILLNSDDDLAISDFGLGRAIDAATTRATASSDSFGTFSYMAPEQLRNFKDSDHRADIYSLGRMLYELYAGHVLGVQDLTLLPSGEAAIVERCTKTNPDERYSTVAEFKDAYLNLFRVRDDLETKSKLTDLASKAQIDGTLDKQNIDELVKLLPGATGDSDLLHDVCMQLPLGVYAQLSESHPHALKSVISAFVDQIVSQTWPFNYTDRIGDKCVEIYSSITSPENRAMLVRALIEISVHHNRWYVMEQATRILESNLNPEEGAAIARQISSLYPRASHFKEFLDQINARDKNIAETLKTRN